MRLGREGGNVNPVFRPFRGHCDRPFWLDGAEAKSTMAMQNKQVERFVEYSKEKRASPRKTEEQLDEQRNSHVSLLGCGKRPMADSLAAKKDNVQQIIFAVPQKILGNWSSEYRDATVYTKERKKACKRVEREYFIKKDAMSEYGKMAVLQKALMR
jgi:hypothetical protein